MKLHLDMPRMPTMSTANATLDTNRLLDALGVYSQKDKAGQCGSSGQASCGAPKGGSVCSSKDSRMDKAIAELLATFDAITNESNGITREDLARIAENPGDAFSPDLVEAAKTVLSEPSMFHALDSHGGKYSGDGKITKSGLNAVLGSKVSDHGQRQRVQDEAAELSSFETMLLDFLNSDFDKIGREGRVTMDDLKNVAGCCGNSYSPRQKKFAELLMKSSVLNNLMNDGDPTTGQGGGISRSSVHAARRGEMRRPSSEAPSRAGGGAERSEPAANQPVPIEPKYSSWPLGNTNIVLPAGIPDNDASKLSKAGVPGGIPPLRNVVATVTAGSSVADIQNAIDRALSHGGGVVQLEDGTYNLSDTLEMKSGVVLRGSHFARLVGQMTSRRGDEVVSFGRHVTGAGLEGVTVTHGKVHSPAPKDFKNRDSNLNVSGVVIRGDRNWIDGANIYNNGTDPVDLKGDNNTVVNSVIDGSANKGGGGNGYFSINSGNNLIMNNEIHNIRHLSIQGGAAYNVVANNNLTTDINFHNGDDGHNAILHNKIDVSGGHNWDAIATGGAKYGHKPPGEQNYLFGNDGAEGFDPDKLMSFSGYRANHKFAM